MKAVSNIEEEGAGVYHSSIMYALNEATQPG